jgi:hypothetical protein
MGTQQRQPTIKLVVETVKAYNQLLFMWFKREFSSKLQIPSCRTFHNFHQVCFYSQRIGINTGITNLIRAVINLEKSFIKRYHLSSLCKSYGKRKEQDLSCEATSFENLHLY